MTNLSKTTLEHNHNHNHNIKNVAITGGTHGNEITGVYCIYYLQNNSTALDQYSFDINLLLANPSAVEQNKRYIEKDFNRCFSEEILQNQMLNHLHEVKLATALSQNLKHAQKKADFIIDLHTTTSNMGTTIIFQSTDWLTLNILRAIARETPHCHFLYEPHQKGDSPYLISCAEHGIMIEIGPTPQGQLMAQCFFDTLKAINITLTVLEQYNQNALPEQRHEISGKDNLPSQEETVHIAYEKVRFPLNRQNQIAAMVHPNLQHRDFLPLHSGDSAFIGLDNSVIPYEGEDCYPIFINEAAYYDERFAFTLTKSCQKVFSDTPYSNFE